MPSEPGLWLVLLVDGVILIGGAAVAVFVLRRGKRGRAGGEQAGREEWNEGVQSLAREVGNAAESFDRPVDPDRVSRRLLPLANRIQGHVRAAPATADVEVYRKLFELGVACQRIAVEHRPARISFEDDRLGDRLNALHDEARALEMRATTAS